MFNNLKKTLAVFLNWTDTIFQKTGYFCSETESDKFCLLLIFLSIIKHRTA